MHTIPLVSDRDIRGEGDLLHDSMKSYNRHADKTKH